MAAFGLVIANQTAGASGPLASAGDEQDARGRAAGSALLTADCRAERACRTAGLRRQGPSLAAPSSRRMSSRRPH
jgi:hypothetical protein